LIGRARQLGVATAEEKLRAVNFLLPFVQRIPDGLLRSEWATRIAQQLRVEAPVLREALRKAATERRSEVKTLPALLMRTSKDAERRLVQMLMESDEIRVRLAEEIRAGELFRGLETEKILTALLEVCAGGERPNVAELSGTLEEKDRRLLFEIAFEKAPPSEWRDAESCLYLLQLWKVEEELATVQHQIEAQPAGPGGNGDELRRLFTRKMELGRRLAELRDLSVAGGVAGSQAGSS
jgi:hypothetical protein